MPELPEVEHGRRVAERVAVGRRISRVSCQVDTIVFAGVSKARMEESLRGRRVHAVQRHGKYLWFELDRRPWPLFHFGMTGAFRTHHDSPLKLEGSPKNPDQTWPPRFTKIHIVFDDGGEMVMTNARRLGRIRLLDDPRSEPPVSELGFDPHHDMPALREFRGLVERRKVTLKGLLLDQGFAAGVGNWIADEVLYQARLDPRRRAHELSAEETKRLHGKLRSVIKTAVRVDARKDRFPKSWLFHHRWGKKTATTSDGQRIEHITVAGRTTAWVPAVQR